MTATTTAAREMLTLPQVSARTGISLDRIRQRAKAVLAPEGLIVKIGGIWLTAAADVGMIAERVGPARK